MKIIFENRFFKIIASLVIIFLCGFFLRSLSEIYSADIDYRAGQRYADAGDIPLALKSANASLSKNPLEPNYYRGRARVGIVSLAYTSVIDEKPIKARVLSDLESAVALNPDNLVTLRNCVPLYYFLAAKDLKSPGSPENVDPSYLPIARDFYNMVKKKFPNDAGVFTLVAKYERRLGLNEEYLVSKERVRTLRPDLLDWQESFR